MDTGENLGPSLTSLVLNYVSLAGSNHGALYCAKQVGVHCNNVTGVAPGSVAIKDINSKYAASESDFGTLTEMSQLESPPHYFIHFPNVRLIRQSFRVHYEGENTYALLSKADTVAGYLYQGIILTELPGANKTYVVSYQRRSLLFNRHCSMTTSTMAK